MFVGGGKGSRARNIGSDFKLRFCMKTNGAGVILKEEFLNIVEVKVSHRTMILKLGIEGLM